MKIISPHGFVQLCDIVGAYLMTQSARAGVDEQNDAVLRQPILRRRLVVENFVHILHFEEMIAGAKCAQLRLSALLRAGADRIWIGPGNATSLFRVIKIGLGAHLVFDRPSRPLLENLIEIAVRNAEWTGAAGARRYVPKELMHQIPQLWLDFLAR